MNKLIISLLLFALISCKFFKETEKTIDGLSCAVERSKRVECGEIGINQQKCEEKGCCWKVDFLVPWCFKSLGSSDSNDKDSEVSDQKMQEIVEKIIKKIEQQIKEGKTDLKKIEEDILKSFEKQGNEMKDKFKEIYKKVKEFFDKYYMSSEEIKAVRKK